MKKLSHYDSAGSARMVDVSAKQDTKRTARAHAFVRIKPEVLRKLPGNPKGDPLEVARRDPQVIFASWCGKKVNKTTIRSRPGWDAVSAVRDDRIFEIKSTYILQPGPASLTEGVRQMHAILASLGPPGEGGRPSGVN